MAIFAEFFEGTDVIKNHVASWDRLALHTSDPNPFFESWCLLPALQDLQSRDVSVLVIWEDPTRHTMLGLVPLVVESKYRGLPIKRTTIWRHDYCYLSTPLIAENRASEVVTSMLTSIGENSSLPAFVSLYWVASESQTIQAITGRATLGFEQKGKVQSTERAMVTVNTDYESSFLPTLNKKKRKELRRNKNRLSELGDLQTQVIDIQANDLAIKSAITDFIALENQGWKNEQGTAIACNKKHQLYFEKSIFDGIKNGGAYIVAMALDAKTIASILLIRSAVGSHAYTVKIASDGDFQQYSLGSLLILETTQFACENPDIIEIDSCAASEHPMINRIWRERKNIVNVNITPTNDFRGAIITMMDYCVGLARKLQSVKT